MQKEAETGGLRGKKASIYIYVKRYKVGCFHDPFFLLSFFFLVYSIQKKGKREIFHYILMESNWDSHMRHFVRGHHPLRFKKKDLIFDSLN
jgi:hypothetical protein